MAEPFLRHSAIAAPLMLDNVDTDQIIPSREMKTVSRDGLADGLFAGWRYTSPATRTPNPDFVLNKPAYSGAGILLGGANFGCGSSREHAVWALRDFGIVAIIAHSFGDIFYENCVRNGLLPIALGEAELMYLRSQSDRLTPAPIEIDLPAQRLSSAGREFTFEIGAYAKRLLAEGLDPIGLTLRDQDIINGFIESDKANRPWLYSAT